jgi:hypothetical protein
MQFLQRSTHFSKNVLQTVGRKLQEDSGTGGFELFMFGKAQNCMERDLGSMTDIIIGFHLSR